MSFFKNRPVWMTPKWRPFFWMLSLLPLCVWGAGLFGLWEAKKAGLIGVLLCIPWLIIVILCPPSPLQKPTSLEKENLITIFSVVVACPFIFLGLAVASCLGLPAFIMGLGLPGWTFSWRLILGGLGLMVVGSILCVIGWGILMGLTKFLAKILRIQIA